MTDGAVEFAVKNLVRRHEQRQRPSRRERITQLRQREKIVFYMFAHIQTDDRIERISDERARRYRGQIELFHADMRVSAEQPLQFIAVTRLDVGRRHLAPSGAKELREVACARSDFEHAPSQRVRNILVYPMIITIKFGELIERICLRQTLLRHTSIYLGR